MREKTLIINSILYFFGSLGKGVASIVVIFMATFFIAPDDMGVYDLVMSAITLLQPIITFQINDGVYRWLLEDESKSGEIIETGFRVVYKNIMIANIILIPFMLFGNIEYKFLIMLTLNLQCIYPMFQQITRGYKNHKLFAVSGIMNGGLVLLVSWVTMKYFGQGIGGFYIAQIIANTAGILFLGRKQKIRGLFRKSDRQKIEKIKKSMIAYSIMLVPNSVNQWIMKALDKYCILLFLTTYDNGIYTVAHRFPDILMMLNSMFYSAWVEQAIVEYKSEDRDAYFSKIYHMYSKIICSVVLILIPLSKYFILFFVGDRYFSAYQYVPFLYIGVIFLGLSGFIGTGYLGTKRTEGILWTSLAGSLVNIIINVFCMPLWGLNAAVFSSFAAYFAMWLVRLWQTRKFFTISIQWKEFITLILLCVLFALGVKKNSFLLDGLLLAAAVLIAGATNYPYIKKALKHKKAYGRR